LRRGESPPIEGQPEAVTEERPAAVIAPGVFRAYCGLCGVEVRSTREWRDHLAGPEHQDRTARAVDHLGEQLDRIVQEMERNAIQAYDLVHQLQTLRGASLWQMVVLGETPREAGGKDGKAIDH
jgi:hypothetical protein